MKPPKTITIVIAIIFLIIGITGTFIWFSRVSQQPANSNSGEQAPSNQGDQKANLLPNEQKTQQNNSGESKNKKEISQDWKTYNNEDFGVSFDYNSKDYTAPTMEGSDIRMFGARESEGAAGPQITISKLSNHDENYIKTYANEYLSDPLSNGGSGCDLLKDNFIAGTISRWVQCAGMGDAHTVLIKHPYRNYIIQIDAPFALESFNTTVKSFIFIPNQNTDTAKNRNIDQTSDKLKYTSKYGFSLDYHKKYFEDNNCGIWTADNESIGLLEEWGVNCEQETAIAIGVYKKGSSIPQDKKVIKENENYVYALSSSYADIDPKDPAYQEYYSIYKSINFSPLK